MIKKNQRGVPQALGREQFLLNEAKIYTGRWNNKNQTNEQVNEQMIIKKIVRMLKIQAGRPAC